MATATEHALKYRRATAIDLFSFGEVDGPEKQSVLDATDAYLKAFVAPVRDADGNIACFHCGKAINGFSAMFGTGVAYQWGLTHGEARCSGCGWPARGMHYPKDEAGNELWALRNFFLAYHPDEVEVA